MWESLQYHLLNLKEQVFSTLAREILLVEGHLNGNSILDCHKLQAKTSQNLLLYKVVT